MGATGTSLDRTFHLALADGTTVGRMAQPIDVMLSAGTGVWYVEGRYVGCQRLSRQTKIIPYATDATTLSPTDHPLPHPINQRRQ